MYIQKRSQRQPHTFVLVALLIGLLTGLGIWGYMLLPMSGSGTNNAANTSTGSRPQDVAASQDIAHQYMRAFFAHHYSTMWSLLHPQVQALWTNQQAFADYWNARFQEYNLHAFIIGQTRMLPSWTNPETMSIYNNVEQIPVSLQLDLKVSPQVVDGVPPENLHPSQLLQNLPFIVQRTNAGRWLVLDGGPVDLEAPILPPTTPVTTMVDVPILMYHHISDVPTYNPLDRSLTVPTTLFNQQLDHLVAQGYHSITFNQLFAALYYNGPLPTKPIILTFDDGYADAYTSAYPALGKHGFSGMFYIITGKVGWQGQMTWAQMSVMLTHGMQMGSHTIHHVDIGQVYIGSYEQAQQELQVSLSTLQQHLGVIIQQFCYPSGEPFRHGSLALRRAIVRLLSSDGYVGATTDPGMTGIEQQGQYPFTLLRLRIDGRDGLQNFIDRLP